MLEHKLSEEEQSQILQTIEMFEVIIQTQPDDYQSLEILKEAYSKVRAEGGVGENFQHRPRHFLMLRILHAGDGGVWSHFVEEQCARHMAMLRPGLEARLQASGHTLAASSASNGLTRALPNYAAIENSKAAIRWSRWPGRISTLKGKRAAAPAEPGRHAEGGVGALLIVQQLFPVDEVNEALASWNRSKQNSRQALSIGV